MTNKAEFTYTCSCKGPLHEEWCFMRGDPADTRLVVTITRSGVETATPSAGREPPPTRAQTVAGRSPHGRAVDGPSDLGLDLQGATLAEAIKQTGGSAEPVPSDAGCFCDDPLNCEHQPNILGSPPLSAATPDVGEDEATHTDPAWTAGYQLGWKARGIDSAYAGGEQDASGAESVQGHRVQTGEQSVRPTDAPCTCSTYCAVHHDPRTRSIPSAGVAAKARCVNALYDVFGVEDDWSKWRDADPEDVVRVVLDTLYDSQSEAGS